MYNNSELGKKFSKGYGSYKIIGSVDFFSIYSFKINFLYQFLETRNATVLSIQN